MALEEAAALALPMIVLLHYPPVLRDDGPTVERTAAYLDGSSAPVGLGARRPTYPPTAAPSYSPEPREGEITTYPRAGTSAPSTLRGASL